MPKQPAELVVDTDWLIPVSEPWEVLEKAAIAVSGGKILAVGARAQIFERYEPARHLSLPNHVLLPGLVNAHGHAAMSLFRGHAEDMPLQSWLNERIWPLEARFADAGFVRDGVRLALAEMISAGITCFSDMYFFPEITAEEARQAGVRAQVAFPLIKFANAWSASTEEGFHKGFELHDRYRNDSHISIAFGPHAVYSIADSDLQKILTFSEELDANIQIHLHENAAELNDCRRLFGTSGIEHLHAHDLLGPRLQAVHVTQITPEEVDLLAAASVQVVHCPTSNAKLGSGLCPVADLLAAGINVCLGTDGAASNNSLDIFGEARIASLLAKLIRTDAAALPARTALEMATSRGARALGMADRIGSLQPGMAADFIAVDFSGPGMQPLYDPVAQLIHTSSGNRVSHVWVDGECLLKDYVLTRMDTASILATANHWRQRIQDS